MCNENLHRACRVSWTTNARIVDDFYTEVIYSSLTEGDKIQLLSAGSGIKSLAVFFSESNNLKHLKNSLFLKQSENSSSITLSQLSMMSAGGESGGGCEVNWRNVWAGGVIAGFIGGAFGLKTGCAGGLVAGAIGAAAGCVGGAVMGFSFGFLWVSIGAIGAELLTSCF